MKQRKPAPLAAPVARAMSAADLSAGVGPVGLRAGEEVEEEAAADAAWWVEEGGGASAPNPRPFSPAATPLPSLPLTASFAAAGTKPGGSGTRSPAGATASGAGQSARRGRAGEAMERCGRWVGAMRGRRE